MDGPVCLLANIEQRECMGSSSLWETEGLLRSGLQHETLVLQMDLDVLPLELTRVRARGCRCQPLY